MKLDQVNVGAALWWLRCDVFRLSCPTESQKWGGVRWCHASDSRDRSFAYNNAASPLVPAQTQEYIASLSMHHCMAHTISMRDPVDLRKRWHRETCKRYHSLSSRQFPFLSFRVLKTPQNEHPLFSAARTDNAESRIPAQSCPKASDHTAHRH